MRYSILVENPIICRCTRFSKYELINDIKKNKYKNVEELIKNSGICCCCKTCYNDVMEIFNEENKSLIRKIGDLICFWKKT